MSLQQLFQEARIWRGADTAHNATGFASGYAALDGVFTDGCWPGNALTEILSPCGTDGLQLLMPILARLSQESGWLAWIDPPHIPYAPALTQHGVDLRSVLVVHDLKQPMERLWAAEQSLRSGACNAVLLWLQRGDFKILRRLQLAAATGQTMGFIFRPSSAREQCSPATLRMAIKRQRDGVGIEVLKCKGRRPRSAVLLR